METAVRTTGSASEANEWALVLTAMGIPHRLEPDDAGWIVLVSESDLTRARRALRAYDAENGRPSEAAPHAAAPGRAAWAVGLGAGALLLAFFAVTGPPAVGSPWFERGAAAAGAMLNGEPWRSVTALTLHVDAVHALGNAIAAALLFPAIAARLGTGAGIALVLLAGAGANLLTAAVKSPQHVAVGASTATFGAIGILAGLRLRTRPTPGRRRGWIVLGAAVLLLAMMGMDRNADVVGHALGLSVGGALGLIAAMWQGPLPMPTQWVLAAATAVTVVGCWRLALAGAT